jgi:N,N'-diacetyllegionaminate synthase
MKRVHILGAGPVGLVCGWLLTKKGYQVDIYERNDRVGGMCRSWEWLDFTLDVGPHIFHTLDKKLKEFWMREFGDLMSEGKYYCQNVKGDSFDEYYHYPLSWEALTHFEQDVKAKIIAEIDEITEYQRAIASTYADYMDAQVGPTLRSMFYEKYPEKIWGIKVSDLTADWAPKRIKFRQKISPFYENEWAAVGVNGTGPVYERIAEHIKQAGGLIHFNTTVTAIENDGDTIRSISLKDGQKIGVGNDDIVISSLPITIMARFFGYQSKLTFRGVRLAYVAINKDVVLPNDMNWLYYDSEKVLFSRVTEPKTMAPKISPAGKTVLVTEVTYSKGDAVDQMSDQAFESRILEDLERVGLVKEANVIDTLSIKEDFVYPVQTKGYQEELAKTRSIVGQFSQLYSLGTGGDFNYADSQILFHMAFDTVGNLVGKDSGYAQTIKEILPVKQNSVVDIKGRRIGDGYQPFIIAEAGINHNGSIELAMQLVDEAVKAGCHAIKFQTFNKSSRVSSKMKSVNYAESADGLQENIFDMFSRLSMSYEDQARVFEYAREKGIEVFSTPFDTNSVDFLESQGVNFYKLASVDLVNIQLLKYVARTMKPMILSTGMSNLSNIEDAVNAVLAEGNPNVILLHCNSSYPAAENEMNLDAINTLKSAFKVPVGLSDHTFGLFVSHTALAIGANVIERHFTLSRTMEGPDHILSSEPGEMATLTEMATRIPILLGDGIKRIRANEYVTLNAQRKCLYAAQDVKAGEIISADKLMVKGPGGGILPKFYDIVVGRRAVVDIENDTPITWDII